MGLCAESCDTFYNTYRAHMRPRAPTHLPQSSPTPHPPPLGDGIVAKGMLERREQGAVNSARLGTRVKATFSCSSPLLRALRKPDLLERGEVLMKTQGHSGDCPLSCSSWGMGGEAVD